jgi:hypothetical protein
MDTNYELPSEQGYTIYTKSQCSFCVKSKTLLKAEPFTMIDCDEYVIEDKESFLKFIENLIGLHDYGRVRLNHYPDEVQRLA